MRAVPRLCIAAEVQTQIVRTRPTARLLVLDPADRVLLFQFAHRGGALDGVSYWATPGGGVEQGESVAAAAIRELREETGIDIVTIGTPVARRQQVFLVDSGEYVRDDEFYFVVRVRDTAVSCAGWTDYERHCMNDHRWWSAFDLAQTTETVWPQDLSRLLAALGDQSG